MADADSVYDNPLIGRYASREMAQRWGPRRRIQTWRLLWITLAEAQAELGLDRIRPEQIAALREHLDDIDLNRAAEHERRLRHDVMAHVHAYRDVAPEAGDILHLGATSAFVTDNAELLLIRESLDDLCGKVASLIDTLSRFALEWKAEPTLGYTHFQPAQLTTVGKRACLWAFDFVLDLRELEHVRDTLALRGAKGTTGTQASFLALFDGDHDKVRQLDRLIASKLSFAETLPVTGQTYSRKIDTRILSAVAGLGESASKWGNDLRLLAHKREIDEPFESEQIGSSAMPYKRNPMRSERMCGLSRFLIGLPAMAAHTTATQWFERTLDDSSGRRLYLPQAFLAADAILKLALNLGNGLVVHCPVVRSGVAEMLPYMATENLLMAAVNQGGDRQELYEVIRTHSHAVTDAVKSGTGRTIDLIDRLKAEPGFAGLNFEGELRPERYIGRAPEQVDEFVTEVVEPIRQRYADQLGQLGEVHL